MALVKRLVKGSPLSAAEYDAVVDQVETNKGSIETLESQVNDSEAVISVPSEAAMTAKWNELDTAGKTPVDGRELFRSDLNQFWKWDAATTEKGVFSRDNIETADGSDALENSTKYFDGAKIFSKVKSELIGNVEANSEKAAKSGDVASAIELAKVPGDKADAYKCFQIYGDLNNLYTQVGGVNKVEFYKAFEILELTGFDDTKPHRINIFWVDGYDTSHFYRFIIQEFDGVNWVNSFDTSARAESHFTKSELGVENGKLTIFSAENNGKKFYAEINYDNLPIYQGFFDSTGSTLIINKSCFKEEVPVIEYLEPSDISTKIGTNVAEMNVLTSKDDVGDGVYNGWLDNSYVPVDITDGAAGQWRTYKLNCTNYQGQNLTFGTTSSSFRKWVFYNNSTQLNYGDYSLNSAETVTVPANATHLYIMLRRYEATEDYDNWRVNVGDQLLDYEVYEQFIDTIDGKKIKEVEDTTEPLTILQASANKNFYNSRRKPTISIVFDGTKTTDLLAYNILQEYGFLANFAVKPSLLNDSNKSVYENAYKNGSSIIAYPYGGLGAMSDPTIPDSEVEEVMQTSKKMLIDLGYKVSGWQTPSSSLHIDFFPIVEKNYGYAFTGLSGGFWNETVDPLKLSRYGLESAFNSGGITAVKARIDTAITNNELLVCYAHEIPSIYLKEDGVTPFMTEAELRELLAYLKVKVDANECQVLATDEAVYQYYKTPFL